MGVKYFSVNVNDGYFKFGCSPHHKFAIDVFKAC